MSFSSQIPFKYSRLLNNKYINAKYPFKIDLILSSTFLYYVFHETLDYTQVQNLHTTSVQNIYAATFFLSQHFFGQHFNIQFKSFWHDQIYHIQIYMVRLLILSYKSYHHTSYKIDVTTFFKFCKDCVFLQKFSFYKATIFIQFYWKYKQNLNS